MVNEVLVWMLVNGQVASHRRRALREAEHDEVHMQDQLTIRSPRDRQTRHESGIAERTPARPADGRRLESGIE